MAKHIYIVDTCVLIHDPHAIFKFQENDVYLPLACLDDLDNLKTSKESVGWSAREVFRVLEQFDLEELRGTKGAKLGEGLGSLFVYNHEAPLSKNETPNIIKTNSDNALIITCVALTAKYPKRKVAIVTKDMGLRMRAITWNCAAENYKSDLIDDSSLSCIRNIEIASHADWELLSLSKKNNDCRVKISDLTKTLQKEFETSYPNEFYVFSRGESQHNIGMYKTNALDGIPYVKILKENGAYKYSGITPLNLEQKMAMEILADREIQLVSMAGPAGCGKTLISLAVALDLIDLGEYDKIVFIKPLVPVGGQEIGFLPGSKDEKIMAWLGPAKDNLETLIQKKKSLKNSHESNDVLKDMIEDGIIEIEAMTFLQGRSIQNAIIILDESQNISQRSGRMVVERCGKDSKVVLLGDLSQIENPYLDKWSCALAGALHGSKPMDIAGSIVLNKVERSKIASIASEIFNKRF